MFFSYTRYLCSSLSRNKFIHISSVLYFFVTIFLIYFLPIILNLKLIVLTRYVYFFMLLMMFGVFNAANIVAFIFRQSIDDGSELIMQTKPIKKTSLAYSKILVYIITILSIAVIETIICAFTSLTYYGGHDIAQALCLNIFLGTILVYILFGGICVFLCLYLKQIIAVISSVSIFLVFMIYSLIANQIFMSIPKYILKTDNIYLDPISLVADNNQAGLDYHGGILGSINSSGNYITKDLYSEIVPDNSIKPENFLQYKWNETVKQKNYEAYLYTNFMYQLASIYTNPPQSFLTGPVTNLSYIIHSSNSFDLKLKFSQEFSNLNFVNFAYNNQNYYLTNNAGVNFIDYNNKIYETSVKNQFNNGTLSYFNNTTPLIYLDGNNISNLTLGYDNTSLQKFVNSYFSTQQINGINWLNELVYPSKTSSALKINRIHPMSYYATYFSLLNSLNTNKYNKKDIFDQIAINLSKFQYLCVLTLQNANNLKITSQQLDIIANCLNIINNPKISRSIITFSLPKEEILTFLSNVMNNPSLVLEKGYVLTPLFSSINQNYLQTFNLVKIGEFYTSGSVFAGWFSLSIIILGLSILVYFKHDFY